MSMSKAEQKFSVGSWWASSPEFVLRALTSQLKAAAVIFPELAAYEIVSPEPTPPAEAGKIEDE